MEKNDGKKLEKLEETKGTGEKCKIDGKVCTCDYEVGAPCAVEGRPIGHPPGTPCEGAG